MTLTKAQRGRLTLDALSALDLHDEDASADDLLLLADSPVALVEGLVQYIGYLETLTAVIRPCELSAIRPAAREAAQALIRGREPGAD